MELQITTKYNEMKFRFKTMFSALMGGLFLAAGSASATIIFTGGQGDLTFFYESAEDRWDIVFRDKGATQASGLNNPYSGFTGIVGADSGDNNFSTLRVNISSAPVQIVNGIGYLVSPANGSSIYSDSSTNPDLGMRFRLRENEVALGNPEGSTTANQFDNVRLTLDWTNSTRPAGAEFALFGWDAFGSPASVLYETADGNFSHDWGNWGHTHWHFGFSEVGDYSLVFDVEGIGGTYGASAGSSQVVLNFNVVPEPSTALLGMFAMGALGLRRRRG